MGLQTLNKLTVTIIPKTNYSKLTEYLQHNDNYLLLKVVLVVTVTFIVFVWGDDKYYLIIIYFLENATATDFSI